MRKRRRLADERREQWDAAAGTGSVRLSVQSMYGSDTLEAGLNGPCVHGHSPLSARFESNPD